MSSTRHLDLLRRSGRRQPAHLLWRTTTFGRHLMEPVMQVPLLNDLAGAPVESSSPSNRRDDSACSGAGGIPLGQAPVA